ncbi:hypothetical protein [Klebsiella pneumoniae]|uniref:hypothetical protein n=1 Tax=Klebsiella pneumoniae TaxID=573 RepID=UPI002DB910F8|nr:hypothetical protein [Klebsiella pneumoniae]MEC4515903.1 hypothetical protein [Klebsiella pneumoniae]
MTSKLTRDRLAEIAQFGFSSAITPANDFEIKELARMALAAMDSSESVELPLDYLQGHKDGLEWAAQLAEANHPETGDWLYDDPIELAKAIRKGPDMPVAQPVADSEPVAIVEPSDYVTAAQLVGEESLRKAVRELYEGALRIGDKLYRHAQPAPVAPDGYVMAPKEPTDEMIAAAMNCEDVLFNSDDSFCVQFGNIYEAMLAAAPQEVKGE